MRQVARRGPGGQSVGRASGAHVGGHDDRDAATVESRMASCTKCRARPKIAEEIAETPRLSALREHESDPRHRIVAPKVAGSSPRRPPHFSHGRPAWSGAERHQAARRLLQRLLQRLLHGAGIGAHATTPRLPLAFAVDHEVGGTAASLRADRDPRLAHERETLTQGIRARYVLHDCGRGLHLLPSHVFDLQLRARRPLKHHAAPFPCRTCLRHGEVH